MGDFKVRRMEDVNKGPVASSFFQTLSLYWASLFFINAKEIINSQGSLVWHLCK